MGFATGVSLSLLEKGKIIEIEDNPWHGIVLVVRMDNGDILWNVADYFKNLEFINEGYGVFAIKLD